MYLAWVLIVCSLITLSFIGWGQLISKKEEHCDVGMNAAYGMALLCILGGILNSLALISRATLVIFITLGLVFWIFNSVKNIRSNYCSIDKGYNSFKNHKFLSILFLLLLLTTLIYATLPVQNEHDDNHAYLVFPHQMLEMGHIGEDPFNERRLGVLGGQSVLNASMLTFVSYQQVGAMDKVVGWLIFMLLIITHGYRSKISTLVLMLLLSIWNWRTPMPVNLSSTITTLALFYALIRRFQTPGIHCEARDLLNTALLVAGLISLKATNVVGLGFLFLALLLFDHRIYFVTRIKQGAAVSSLALLMVTPWMLALYQSSHTLFFPLLGQGTHISWENGAAILSIRLQDIDWQYAHIVLTKLIYDPTFLGCLFFLGLSIGFRRKILDNLNPTVIPVMIGAALTSVLLTVLSLGMSRYSYPFMFAAFSFALVETLSITPHKSGYFKHALSVQPKHWLAWITITFYAGTIWPDSINRINNKIAQIYHFAETEVKTFPKAFLHAAQKTIPSEESFLAILSNPYLIDFKRNTAYIVDHAGSAGLKGGLPIHSNSEELATYLTSLKINFIIYSHYDEGGYSYHKYKNRLNFNGSPYADRVRVLTENNFKLRRQVEQLATRYKVTYLDELFMVINLKQATGRH